MIGKCLGRDLSSGVSVDTVSVVCRDQDSYVLQDQKRVVGNNTRRSRR